MREPALRLKTNDQAKLTAAKEALRSKLLSAVDVAGVAAVFHHEDADAVEPAHEPLA